MEHFTKKNCKKVIKRKGNKLYGKQKGYSGYFSSWIDKKDMNKLVWPKLKSFGVNVKVELDLSNYATQVDLKNATGVNVYPILLKKK